MFLCLIKYKNIQSFLLFLILNPRLFKILVTFDTIVVTVVPIDFVFGAYKSYLNFRESFFKAYDVFSDPFEGVDVDELDEEERVIYNEEIKQREKQGDQWMTVVNALSANDVTKFEKVLKLNLFLCFNQLSFLKSHNS